MFPSPASHNARSLDRLFGSGGRWMLLGAIAAILSGCSLSGCSLSNNVSQKAEKWLRWHPALSRTQERTVLFEFEVTPRDRGIYELKGQTELPEGSQLAIAALRYLKLDPDVIRNPIELESELLDAERLDSEQLESDLNIQEIATFTTGASVLGNAWQGSAGQGSVGQGNVGKGDAEQVSAGRMAAQLSRQRRLALKPSYVILDYQPVTVSEGQWQTELNLWQVAKDGRYQESWQLHQEELALQWKAEPEVLFLATLLIDGAADRLQALQNQLAEQQFILNRSLIQTSPVGEQYFQAMQSRSVALPQSQTAPPPVRVQDINGGWGRRYLLVEQDPLPGTLAFPDQRHRNDAGSPKEFIQ